MRRTAIRSAVLALLLTLAAPAGVFGAASLTDFNQAVENAAAHNRVALGYLRTGNTDLATLELERLRGAWATVVATFGKDRPDAFAPELFTTTLTDISTRLVTADMMLSSGRAEAAETALAGVREEAKVGQRTTLDVLNAQQALLNARVNLVTSQRDRVVASYAALGSIGRLSAHELNLNVAIYDPSLHLYQVHDQWFGLDTPDGR